MASLCGTSLIFPLLQKSPFCISRMAGCLLLHLSCVCVFACVIMHIYVCVWVDREIGPVSAPRSARAKHRCRCSSVGPYSVVLCCAELRGCGKTIRVDFRENRGRMRKLQTDRPNGCAEGRGCGANSCRPSIWTGVESSTGPLPSDVFAFWRRALWDFPSEQGQ